MPVTPTYPGVYIEEIPSGVRTITGVATSITAFLGRAERGPLNEPVTINGFADFERVFGGLWRASTLGYSVQDFFGNGGGQAVVVRLFRPFFEDDEARTARRAEAETEAQTAADAVAEAASTAAAEGTATPESVADAAEAAATTAGATGDAARAAADAVAAAARAAVAGAADADAVATAAGAAVTAAVSDAADAAAPRTSARIPADTLNLVAASEGAWGNDLRARVTYVDDVRVLQVVADRYGLQPTDFFNLVVRDTATGVTEEFGNLTVVDSPRRADRVLESESALVRVDGALPGARPAEDGDPAPDTSIWADDTASTGVAAAGMASDGNALSANDFTGPGTEANKRGLYALEKADLFNLLCIPPYTGTDDIDTAVATQAMGYCQRKRAMFIMDPPSDWTSKEDAVDGAPDIEKSKNGAIFFPRIRRPDPLQENRLRTFAPCGAVAGVISRTDAERGVWKAPAGTEARLMGVPELSISLSDAENGELNPLGVNCLRVKTPAGRLVWGARTLEGDDRLASEWKYIPVRRLALYIEESLFRGTQWVVFEPNDEPLWGQIRTNIGAFMQNLFRQGAFQGKTPREAYLVKCDRETTTQHDINLGRVNIVVGFAPLKPAEFVIIRIQQMAGQLDT